ncbi:MAG: hypothetical protein ACP5KN_02165, partial [Armatimonadota bacterium]
GALVAAGAVLMGVGVWHSMQNRRSWAVMPDLVGSLSVLTGLAILGAGGHNPGWEALSFLAAAGLIALSVSRRNQVYLGIGALFLSIDIFTIGVEYVGDTVGLPLTLLVCGGLSMAVGYLVHTLRREHIVRARRMVRPAAGGVRR